MSSLHKHFFYKQHLKSTSTWREEYVSSDNFSWSGFNQNRCWAAQGDDRTRQDVMNETVVTVASVLLCQSAGRSATPASTRTSAHAAGRDSTFTWANARRAAQTAWSTVNRRGSVFPVSALVSSLSGVGKNKKSRSLSLLCAYPVIANCSGIYNCAYRMPWRVWVVWEQWNVHTMPAGPLPAQRKVLPRLSRWLRAQWQTDGVHTARWVQCMCVCECVCVLKQLID